MKLALAVVVGLTLMAGSASASTVDIYQVGCSTGTAAFDPADNPLACSSVISWNDVVGPDPILSATISIVAEGVDHSDVDASEFDAFYVNDVFVGYLTQQPFYSPLYNIQPGAGALPRITALSTSVFDITAYLVNGNNSFKVIVDPTNWVNEIETATLDVDAVPEPTSLMLLGSGLVAGAWRARRRTRSQERKDA